MPPGISIHNCFSVDWLLDHPITDHSAKLCKFANFGIGSPRHRASVIRVTTALR